MSPFLGIDVGDQFCSRAEMVALGIHSHWFKGIDYMGAKYRDKVMLNLICRYIVLYDNIWELLYNLLSYSDPLM
jgi:hypothetical protein